MSISVVLALVLGFAVCIVIAVAVWPSIHHSIHKPLTGCALARHQCLRYYCPTGPLQQCIIPPGGGCPYCDPKDPSQYFVDIQYGKTDISISFGANDGSGESLLNIQRTTTGLTFQYSFYEGRGTAPPPPGGDGTVYAYNTKHKTFSILKKGRYGSDYIPSFDTNVVRALDTFAARKD